MAFEHPGERAKEISKDVYASTRYSAAAFWLVALNGELAGLAFSPDNMVMAVTLSDQFWVVYPEHLDHLAVATDLAALALLCMPDR
ncbi:MAG: hypothetical protein RMK79_03525 [Anaerolineae bacterium]|nr:hypothetical protein [Anaerolineae bacterium]